MEKKLTLKQNKFVNEYIKTGNGTQSAIKAGYSEKTARFIGSENLTKPNVKHKIELSLNEAAKKLGINAEYVLENLKFFADKKKKGWANHAIKSNELLGKSLKLFNDNDINLTLLRDHRETIKKLEEFE